MREKTPVFDMKPHIDKIVESILHVVTLAAKKNEALTRYDIVKTLFLSDRKHLNDYGRPITFDNYFAMQHGPVPSLAYSILKNDANARKIYNKPLPWKSHKGDGNKYFYDSPQREINEDILSQSDMDYLSEFLVVVKALGFSQIRKLTHEDAAYINAWEDESGQNSSFPMSYALLFDTPNFEEAALLAEISRHI